MAPWAVSGHLGPLRPFSDDQFGYLSQVLGSGCQQELILSPQGLTPSAIELQRHYRDLRMPFTIITGADNRIADVGRQSERLHRVLPQSVFIALPELGHMVHHLDPEAVASAVERAA